PKTDSRVPAAARADPAKAVKRPAATPAPSAAASNALQPPVAGPANKIEETAAATSLPAVIDSEAAPAVKPRPATARTKQRPAAEPAPKISAAAQSVEIPDAKSAPADANIEKQVRPPSNRETAEASF